MTDSKGVPMAGSPERLAVRSVSQTETQKAVMGSLPLKRDLYQKKKKKKVSAFRVSSFW